VGLNPTQGMDVCVYSLLSCHGSSLPGTDPPSKSPIVFYLFISYVF
jgi:hypothetical protein